MEAGVKLGMNFHVGNYATKGCYAYYEGKYKGNIYYGKGGTDAQIKQPLEPNSYKIYRPPWFDCAGKMAKYIRNGIFLIFLYIYVYIYSLFLLVTTDFSAHA